MRSWSISSRPWFRPGLAAASAVLLTLATIPAMAQSAGSGMCAGGAGGGGAGGGPGRGPGGGQGGADNGFGGGSSSSAGTSSAGLMQAMMMANQMQQSRQQQMQQQHQERHRYQQQMAPILQAQARQALADRQAQEERRKAARANRFRSGAEKTAKASASASTDAGKVTPNDLERQAEARLRLAQKLVDIDRTDAARESLEQIVSDYASTEAAGAARKLLSSL